MEIHVYCITEEKTEMNSKEERSTQNLKKFRTVCLLTLFLVTYNKCICTIAFIMFKQNFVVTVSV